MECDRDESLFMAVAAVALFCLPTCAVADPVRLHIHQCAYNQTHDRYSSSWLLSNGLTQYLTMWDVCMCRVHHYSAARTNLK